jgi:hypothetical protein
MSEYFTFTFDFNLDPNLPPYVLKTFTALAKGEAPNQANLSKLDNVLQAFLATPEHFFEGRGHIGNAVTIENTGIIGSDPDSPFYVRPPAHKVLFHFTMHDDAYYNGGYVFPLAIFDFVHDHGLFCISWNAGTRQSTDHYFKEFNDLLSVRIETPNFAYPLPPAAKADPGGFLGKWSPANKEDFQPVCIL